MKSPKLATDNRLKKLIKSYLWNRTCWFFAVLWWPFWKWRPVEIVWCRESIQDVEIEQCWICALLWWPFWKWRPVEILRCKESIRDIIIYPHMKCCWNQTMLDLCGIVVAMLKMETGRNFSMSGINSGHHNLPTYEMALKLDNVEFVRIVVAILKMSTGRNFSMFEINLGHDYLPRYQFLMISYNVEFLQYCGGHFENGDR